LSEKEILVALLTLVASLAKKITGETPVIKTTLDNDDVIELNPKTEAVLWYQGDSLPACLKGRVLHSTP